MDFTAERSEPLLRLTTMSLRFGRKSGTEATVTIGAQLTSTQKGKVTEQMVASALLIASDGRLAPFVPLADDHGLDLIVLDKLTRRSVAIQVKSAIANAARETVQFDVRKATHSATDGEYLLLVHFDSVRMVLAAFWLIPTASIARVATEQPDKFALRPSLKLDARDRCRRYRYDDAHALAAAILRVIETD